jgi:hypothetical protein
MVISDVRDGFQTFRVNDESRDKRDNSLYRSSWGAANVKCGLLSRKETAWIGSEGNTLTNLHALGLQRSRISSLKRMVRARYLP